MPMILVAQVANDEIVCLGFGKLWILEIDTPDPITLRLEALGQVRADETARSKNQGTVHRLCLH
jgi:hypothetical protein